MSIVPLLVNGFLRKCYRSQNQEMYVKATQVIHKDYPSYFQVCVFVSKQFSFDEIESLGQLLSTRGPFSHFCELQLSTFCLETISAMDKSVWVLQWEQQNVWRPKLVQQIDLDKVNSPQGTLLQVCAIGDLPQELDAVSTMCARSCLLHPSLQFVAQLNVIGCHPIINIVNEDGALSVDDKLRLQFRSEFDYVLEAGSAVTHVLVNCKAVKSTSVAELYIAVNGVIKSIPAPLITRLVSEPWPIEGSEPLTIQDAISGFQLRPHPLQLQNLVIFIEVSSSQGLFEYESKIVPSTIVENVLAAVKQLNIRYEAYKSRELRVQVDRTICCPFEKLINFSDVVRSELIK